MNAATHATAVLYSIENRAHFLLPVSCAIADIVAMQGKNNRMNTRNAAAERGVKSPEFFRSPLILSSESLLYNTPSVLTTSSFAGILVIMATLERQFCPIGASTGSTACPNMAMKEFSLMPLMVSSLAICLKLRLSLVVGSVATSMFSLSLFL